MAQPAVSVIVPTFNRAPLLPRALDSIIAQTYDDWEIVLVDDGSTDDTPAVADRYAQRLGDRITVLRQDNRGSSAARNRGIEASRGRYVAFLDSDDEFALTKLERQMALFGRRRELGLVYADYAYVDERGRRCDSAFDTKCPLARTVRSECVAPGLRVCTQSLFDALLAGYFIATIVGVVRRDVLGAAIRFAEHLSYAEEWLFYLRVARRCRAGFVDEPLCVHHFTTGSLARSDKSRNAVRYVAVLDAIRSAFPDLPRRQRRLIRFNLAVALRQAGYDAIRDARPRDAVRAFHRAFRVQPRLRDLLTMSSAVSGAARRGLLPRGDRGSSQADLCAVR